jgi:hypothetical protein
MDVETIEKFNVDVTSGARSLEQLIVLGVTVSGRV